MSVDTADVAVQRHPQLVGRRLRHGQAGAEHRIGAQAGLVVGAVEIDQGTVDLALIERVETGDRVGDLEVDEADRGQHPLATEAGAAVAQLDRFVFAGGRAARHRGSPEGTGSQHDVDLNGRVATRVQDLAALNMEDLAHGVGKLVPRSEPCAG